MNEIARRADVSIKTVEAVFGTKAALLRVVVDVAIAGDDEPVALLDRPVMQQLGDETDLGRFFGLYAGLVTDISGRLAPLVSVVEQAAQTDPEIAGLWRTMCDNRLFGARHVAGLLNAKAAIWPDVAGDRAADVLFLFNDPLVYRTLVTDRGWKRDAFRSWLAGTYQDLLVSGRRRNRNRP